MSGAVKHDGQKVRLELVPMSALFAVGDAFTYGAKKYADHNYRKGMAWSRLLGAALRHLCAWGAGEDRDPESGLPHLAHAGACVLMLLDAELNQLGTDDRWKANDDSDSTSAPGTRCDDPTCGHWRCGK
jgi:hypothetical protein